MGKTKYRGREEIKDFLKSYNEILASIRNVSNSFLYSNYVIFGFVVFTSVCVCLCVHVLFRKLRLCPECQGIFQPLLEKADD